nr:hypothetical protein [Zhongshania aquimaris]
MDLDWNTDKELTVTGGLPFFGGAGNNYSTHAIASLTDKLRETSDGFGLITANGGFLSKQSVGLYSAQAPQTPCHNADPTLQATFDNLPVAELAEQAEGEAVVETYTLVYTRGKPSLGIVIGRLDDGRRFLANTAADDDAAYAILQGDSEVIGRKIAVTHKAPQNIVRFI